METEHESMEGYASWQDPAKKPKQPLTPSGADNDYLDRNLESTSIPKLLVRLPKGMVQTARLGVPHDERGLPTPLLKYERSGDAKVMVGKQQENFSYIPIEQADESMIDDRLLFGVDRSQYRLLTDWELSDGKNKIKLAEILPEGCPVIINARQKIVDAPNRHTYTDESEIIVIGADLTTPYGVLALLHEIGHARAHARHKAEGTQNRYMGRFERDGLANTLREERNAWAFALNTLRPLINKNNSTFWYNRKAIRSMIHDFCLNSYSTIINFKRIKPVTISAGVAPPDIAVLETEVAADIMPMIDEIEPK